MMVNIKLPAVNGQLLMVNFLKVNGQSYMVNDELSMVNFRCEWKMVNDD